MIWRKVAMNYKNTVCATGARIILPALMLVALSSKGICGLVTGTSPKRNTNIDYISKDIPPVSVQPWKGNTYQSMVPDTLDLSERARLALHGVMNILDPEYDYELYWLAEFNRIPPVAIHQTLGPPWLDGENYKVMETIPLLRLMGGSYEQLGVDQRIRERTLHQIGPDGLSYWPEKGRPWQAIDIPVDGWSPAIGDNMQGQICTPSLSGRLIGTMALYWLQDQDPIWKETIEKMIDRMAELVIEKDGYAYMPEGAITPGAVVSDDMPMPVGNSWSCQPAWLVQGLAQYYRVAGYAPARELAEKLAYYLMGPAGNFEEDGTAIGIDHLHHHTAVIMAVADLARVTGNRELAEKARTTYEYARRQGDPLVGFYPEGMRYLNDDGTYEYRYRGSETAETCEIADLITAALKLAEIGYDEYLDDVDRWVRNQFAENQMMRADWIYRLIENHRVPADTVEVKVREKGEGHALRPGNPIPLPVLSPGQLGDRVPERHIGTFAGWPSANDYALWDPEEHGHLGSMHCCTANGNRTIYYVWDHILGYREGTLRVNLLLNRASPWADVNSYIPYEGQVDVLMKESCRLEIRIPEWVKPGEVACEVNEEDRALSFQGRYAQVGDVARGDTVSMSFPIAERTLHTKIGGLPYTVVIKGNSVVFIDPPGKHYPLYQRDHYREDKVRWVKRERFVADQVIHW
jgi:hypothetical protein